MTAACQPTSSDPDMLGGREVFPTCAACHGADGSGGAGPSLAGVRETFPDCETHVQWIRLGSAGWKTEVGPTYGADNAPVDQVMPSFGTLDETTLRRVAMYERVRFGGGDPNSERAACGLS